MVISWEEGKWLRAMIEDSKLLKAKEESKMLRTMKSMYLDNIMPVRVEGQWFESKA